MARWIAVVLAVCRLASAQSTSNSYTFEKEARLGQALAEDVRRQSPPIADAPLVNYLERLAVRFGSYARSPFPAHIEITRDLVSREVIALPGGYLFVPLGALTQAASEAEVVRILAHSMAHLAERHGTREATAAQGGLASLPLIFDPIHRQRQNPVIPASVRERRRQAEIEADRLAGEWIAQAGQPPETGEFATFQERAKAIASALAPPPRQAPSLRNPRRLRRDP